MLLKFAHVVPPLLQVMLYMWSQLLVELKYNIFVDICLAI